MSKRLKKRILSIDGVDEIGLLGVNDANLRLLEEHYPDSVTVRGNEIILHGAHKAVDELTTIFETLIGLVQSGRKISKSDLSRVLDGKAEENGRIDRVDESVVYYSSKRRKGVVPRTDTQKAYVEAINDFDVVFAVGPAGTGKTFLAIAAALAALKRGEIEKVFISRPVVETGENLGFLPGDLQEKIDPYLRPIFDSFSYMIGLEKMQSMIEKNIIELAPLAYMRGRTLNNAFAILDEAQNSTTMQMKMFLTRLGVNSKAIVTGDITQIDLAEPSKSGLVTVKGILEGVEGVKFVYFTDKDVVRHSLVKRIIKAFSDMQVKQDISGETRSSEGDPDSVKDVDGHDSGTGAGHE